MRFGWAFITGLLPLVGDFADIGLNYYLFLRKARQADLPGWPVRRMLMNNLVSAGVGFIPVAGDVVPAMFKVNNWTNDQRGGIYQAAWRAQQWGQEGP